jgi:hypothetical protein
VLHWFANIIREPENKTGTSLALRGEEGAGKNLLFDYFGRILGHGYLMVSNADHIYGKHNQHLADVLLLHAAEALYPGDRKHRSIIRSLITDATRMVEPKFIDATPVVNHLRLALSTNEERVAAVTRTDRRWTTLDLGERKIAGELLQRFLKERDAGGPAALLHHLLMMEYDTQLARGNIKNEVRREQQIYNLEPLDAWLAALLEEGVLPGFPGCNAHPNAAPTMMLFGVAQKADPQLRYLHINSFVAHLLRVLKTKDAKEPQPAPWRTEHYRGWCLPPLSVCRKRWENYYKGEWTWNNKESTEWEHGYGAGLPEF